ncbi:MAG: cytochrome c-type biogenesis protein CcmH [Oceanospirillaceae bacterium]|nr:cytochrome c-type biogenesis protein CcmH [Oceanospirillaceae bacterium]
MNKRWLLLTLLLMATNVFSAIDTFEFSNDEQRQRFQLLSDELRCPKCQNQNLSGSNSGIALDLRKELHRMVLTGQSTKQIKGFMVERYGEFVLYKPSVNSLTYVLWYGPFVLLIMGFVVVFLIGRSKKSTVAAIDPNYDVGSVSSKEHQQQLKALLDKKHD